MIDTKSFEKLGMTPKDGKLTSEQIATVKGLGCLRDKRFDDVELTNYTIDREGSKIMVFNSENIPMMNIYNSTGILKYTVTTQQQSDFVDINNYNIIYNNNRDIFLGKPNSRKLSKYTASMDIKKLVLIDSRTFAIVYSNSVEFVKM